MEVRKASPVVMIAQTIRASLLANATATTLAGLRALSAASQSHNAPLHFGAARKTEMAPNTRGLSTTWIKVPSACSTFRAARPAAPSIRPRKVTRSSRTGRQRNFASASAAVSDQGTGRQEGRIDPLARLSGNDRNLRAPWEGGAFQRVQAPSGQPLQPEATGAVMEVTKCLKPSVWLGTYR